MNYNFSQPDAVFPLHKDLAEVSAITAIDSLRLVAVADDKDNLFFINHMGQLLDRVPLDKVRDYEGLALVGNELYATVGKGNLFKFNGWRTQGNLVNEKLSLPGLDSSDDTEGLAFDKTGNRLLVACKEQSPNEKEIYEYKLDGSGLNRNPVYKVRLSDLQTHAGNLLTKFKPSALAVHPTDHSFYILSSNRPAIAVMDRNGNITATDPLDPVLFPQPEGLAFLPNGDLFISNEDAAKKGEVQKAFASLLRFNATP